MSNAIRFSACTADGSSISRRKTTTRTDTRYPQRTPVQCTKTTLIKLAGSSRDEYPVPVLVIIPTTDKPVDRVVPLVDDAGVKGVLGCRMPKEFPSGRTGTYPPVVVHDLALSRLQLLDWPQDGGYYESLWVLKD